MGAGQGLNQKGPRRGGGRVDTGFLYQGGRIQHLIIGVEGYKHQTAAAVTVPANKDFHR